MGEEFIPLAQWIASRAEPESVPIPEPSVREEAPSEPHSQADEALEEVRRFRAALEDALEIACADLLADITVDIVGRELRMQPVEIRSIVARTIARYAHEFPLAVRVHPADSGAIADEYPTVADGRLRRGDAVIEVRTGTIDARLGVRLERLLRRFS